MGLFISWIILAATLQRVTMQQGVEWTYKGEHGADKWPVHFEQCSGFRQSPIHIHSGNIQHNTKIGGFFFGGHENIGRLNAVMSNSGKAVEVKLSGSQFIEDGGLKGRYIAAQFHFHWGRDLSQGSEHVVNKRRYPMELHVVHYAERYGNLSTAVGRPDGLAVLSLMFEAVEEDNVHFTALEKGLETIIEPGQTVNIDEFCLKTIFPGDMNHFYRYYGSLTTPRCQESVIWTIFKDTVPISKRQLEAFRRLRKFPTEVTTTPALKTIKGREFMDQMYLGDNFRPVQDLNGRVVYTTFDPALLNAGKLASTSASGTLSGISFLIMLSSILTVLS